MLNLEILSAQKYNAVRSEMKTRLAVATGSCDAQSNGDTTHRAQQIAAKIMITLV